jgi:hypothetical protein
MKILIGFRGVRFVERVRRFGEIKILMGFRGVRFLENVISFGK